MSRFIPRSKVKQEKIRQVLVKEKPKPEKKNEILDKEENQKDVFPVR